MIYSLPDIRLRNLSLALLGLLNFGKNIPVLSVFHN